MRLISKDCSGYQAHFSLSRQLQEEMFGPGAFHRKPYRNLRLGASGGELLVPPRSSARMRLKEALKGLLPQTKPPSLRILPARTWYREAGFRRFLRKHPHDQPIPCQCAHWRGIEDHFGFWKRLPVAITCYRFLAFSRNAPWRSPTQWVCQITQFHSAQIGAFSAPGVP